MILYTPLPEEVINCNPESTELQFKELGFCGGRLIVQPIGPATFKISRIISTDPQIYLDPRLQPGVVINLTEEKFTDLELKL
ncbi:MAG: YlzJ-like family protein [Bacillota bacterium]